MSESAQAPTGSGVEAKFHIVSQNVQKSWQNATILLETHREADMVLMQEPPWRKVKSIVSTTNKDGDDYMNTVAHRDFVCIGAHAKARAITYVNRRWTSAGPRQVASIKHDDIICVALTGKERTMRIMNVYNDSKNRSAMKYLREREENLPRITVMAGDFNARHPIWEPTYTRNAAHHIQAATEIIQLAGGCLNMTLANTPGITTWQSNNEDNRPGVLDLVWVEEGISDRTSEVRVDITGRNRSDHAILEWSIPLELEQTNEPKIIRDSEAEEQYIKDVRQGLTTEEMQRREICSVEMLKEWENDVDRVLRDAWTRNATAPRKSKKSKSWWTANCTVKARAVRAAREARNESDSQEERRRKLQAINKAQIELKRATKKAKREFFDRIIEETKPQKVWDLVGWTKPRKQNANITLTDNNGREASSAEEVCDVFKEQFVPSNPREVDETILNEYPQLPERDFKKISTAEIMDCLKDTSNKSAPGPDKCTWRLWKKIMDGKVVKEIAKAYNACIEYAHFPKIFKKSVTVVIPKPNKDDYSKAKAYRPIVLLNCLGKLMEKVLAKRIQFETQKHNITHPCQYGGTMQHSTTDAGIQLVHNIKEAWKRKLDSTVLLLDISQFFPSLNHNILVGTMRKQGFAGKLCEFFGEYLKDRSTQFLFNGQKMDETDITVGVGQGSALSPILSAIYIASVVHKWAPIHMNTYGNMTLQFFVDDGLIHVAAPAALGTNPQAGQLQANCDVARRVFADVTEDLMRVGLGVERSKLEMMHFRRGRNKWSDDEPLGPSIKLSVGGRHVNAEEVQLQPEAIMRYLGFFLDPKLSWREHIRMYTTKASSTVNSVRMLGNSNRGLSPAMKRKLYISNVLPILTYGAQLWWNPKWRGIGWILKSMAQTQAKAVRWITGAFKTTPTGAMEMMAGLLPIRQQINYHMKKMNMRTHKLHKNHPVRATLGAKWRRGNTMSAPFKIQEEGNPVNTPLTHINTVAENTSERFEALHEECTPGMRIIDQFEDRIRWDLDAPKKGSEEWKKWMASSFTPKLGKLMRDQNAIVVFTDGSRKSSPEITTGAAWHVYHSGQKVAEGAVGCGRATAYDAEMMAAARGLSEAVRWARDSPHDIHLFANNKGAMQTILKPRAGPAQYLAIQAAKTVRSFLNGHRANTVHLHWCPGHAGVKENEMIDEAAKEALEAAQPEFISWSVATGSLKKEVTKEWKEERNKPEYRGHQNLIPQEDESLITNSNKNWFIQKCGGANKQMAKMVRVVTGHAPCGALRFLRYEGNRSSSRRLLGSFSDQRDFVSNPITI